ncbi:cytochrome C [Sulfitobacter sp. BDSS02]|nr:cytochrome C [Sulfitobacter sp. BDSS02]MBR9848100.1 cytochrome C [Paracoccaceae bacterium]
MKPTAILATLALSLATPSLADSHASGDAKKGEREFNKCRSCHTIVSDSGDAIVKGGKVGPNLYGILNRTPGSVNDYNYSEGMVALGETGIVWDEAHFTDYVMDPTAYLKKHTEDSSARSKMTFKLRKEEDAANVWAYLVSVGPAAE